MIRSIANMRQRSPKAQFQCRRHMVIGFQMNLFLLEVVKLQPNVVGGIVLSARIWDGALDPAVAVLATRTKSRYGTFKPWIVGSITPVSLAFIAIWAAPPWWSEDARAGYVTVAYLLFLLAISMYHVPYLALNMHLSHVQAEIDSATVYRVLVSTIAIFMSSVLATVVDPLGQSSEQTCNGSRGGLCAYSSFQRGFVH